MTDQPTNPAAGWYADPGGSGELRWWDGAAWTPHTHADPSASSTSAASTSASTATPPSSPAQPSTPTPMSAPTNPNPGAGAGPAGGPSADVPWWAQSGDGKPPSWWADGTAEQRNAWNASNAVGDRKGPADPSSFGVPGAVPESKAAPMTGPYAHTRAPRAMARADGAVKALVLGIVSLICCGIILGPVAIYEGSQVRYRVRTSNGRLDGDGFGLAAMILGAIATVLSIIGIILAATGHSTFGTSGR